MDQVTFNDGEKVKLKVDESKGIVSFTKMPIPKCKLKFNPHEYSLVAVMVKEGEKILRDRLKMIKRRNLLLEMARAQHIPVDSSVFSPSKKVPLKRAVNELIDGVNRRINSRMAAAS